MLGTQGKKPAGTSGSYTPIKNVSFVGREFFADCDDEVVESRDGLYDEFGGDNYCVSKDARYLGLARGDDGCEPLDLGKQEPDDILDNEENDGDEIYDYDGYEDADMAVFSAVREVMDLAEFFRNQREMEKHKAEREAMAEARELYPEDYDEPEPIEPAEVEEKMVRVKRSISRPGYNHGMWQREHRAYTKVTEESWDWDKKKMVTMTYNVSRLLGYYFRQAQRCHGGTDNRRYRKGDLSGKMIGNNHRRRSADHDRDHVVLRPVAVVLTERDGKIRRLRVA